MIKTADEVNKNVYRYLVLGDPVDNLIKIIEVLQPDNNAWYMEVLDDSCDDYGATWGEEVSKIEDIKGAFEKVDPLLVTLSFKKNGKEVYVPARFTANNDLIVHCGDDLKDFFEGISDGKYDEE